MCGTCERYREKYNEDTGELVSIIEVYDSNEVSLSTKNVLNATNGKTDSQGNSFSDLAGKLKCCKPANLDTEIKSYNVCAIVDGDDPVTLMVCETVLTDLTNYVAGNASSIVTTSSKKFTNTDGTPVLESDVDSYTIGECKLNLTSHGVCATSGKK